MKKILKRINALIQENRDNQNKIYLQTQELEWASVYHDSIRGNKWLGELPLTDQNILAFLHLHHSGWFFYYYQ